MGDPSAWPRTGRNSSGSSLREGSAAELEAGLWFTRSADVGPDAARPGLLRARAVGSEAESVAEAWDVRRCRIRDWGGEGGFRPELLRHGFECIDLTSLDGLAEALERVREAGHVGEEDVREIRARLSGARLRLGDGSRVRLLTIAPEGFIMRKAGPNRMPVSPAGAMSPMNDHDAARAVHADQDVLGTPLRQMLRGAAPWLFRHDAPDSRNGWSPLMLLNLWIPLQQITRPLALMDKRSIDRRAHQLRYGLATDAFLDRDESQRVNDIWSFLHDAGQRWYFHSELHADRAYLFETLGTPHGSFVVPGEERAERATRRLAAVREALERGDEPGLRRALEPTGGAEVEAGTAALRRAISAMESLLEEAGAHAAALCRGEGAPAWSARAARATDAVVRKSIEMRVVAVRTPRLWPTRIRGITRLRIRARAGSA